MTPHPTGSHVRLSPSPKGEGRKTTRLRVASNRRADWQVVLCARGARASSQGLCPPRLWRHEPQAKYNEEPPAKLVGYFLYTENLRIVRGVRNRLLPMSKKDVTRTRSEDSAADIRKRAGHKVRRRTIPVRRPLFRGIYHLFIPLIPESSFRRSYLHFFQPKAFSFLLVETP